MNKLTLIPLIVSIILNSSCTSIMIARDEDKLVQTEKYIENSPKEPIKEDELTLKGYNLDYSMYNSNVSLTLSKSLHYETVLRNEYYYEKSNTDLLPIGVGLGSLLMMAVADYSAEQASIFLPGPNRVDAQIPAQNYHIFL